MSTADDGRAARDAARVAAIRAALAGVLDPEIRRPITELDMVAAIAVGDGRAAVELHLTIAGCPAAERISADVRAAVERVTGPGTLDLTVGTMSPAQRDALVARLRGPRARQHPFVPGGLTRVIAVTSGKGGVGKSTLTANLAVALVDLGCTVGVIDADVHGHSIPALLGISDPSGGPVSPTRVGDLMMPPIGYGVKAISIGMFAGADRAVAWRGPMLHRTVQQFLADVYFGDLDFLLIDLPPGTGDVAISLGQLLPHAEVLVVTTPQPAAAEVAVRSGLVARQTGQRVVGVVENMVDGIAPDGTALALFGSGGGASVAEALTAADPDAAPVPLLAAIPLSVALRVGGDAGRPVVRFDPDDRAAAAIRTLASELAARGRNLAGRRLDVRPC